MGDYTGLDGLSRLKGIEIMGSVPPLPDRQYRLDGLSRLKGIEIQLEILFYLHNIVWMDYPV